MIEKVSQIALTYFSQLLYKVTTRVSSAYETKDLKKSHVSFFIALSFAITWIYTIVMVLTLQDYKFHDFAYEKKWTTFREKVR